MVFTIRSLTRRHGDRVQRLLAEHATRRTGSRQDSDVLLAGKLFDDRGNRMSPSHATKGGRRWRYYVSQAILQGRKQDAGSVRASRRRRSSEKYAKRCEQPCPIPIVSLRSDRKAVNAAPITPARQPTFPLRRKLRLRAPLNPRLTCAPP